MSLSRDGQLISCDSAGCKAAVPAPVALRSKLTGSGPGTTAGWLFVVRQNVNYHYCPACAERQLAYVRGNDLASMNDAS